MGLLEIFLNNYLVGIVAQITVVLVAQVIRGQAQLEYLVM